MLTILITVAIVIALAVLGKCTGRFFATIRLTDATSAKRTVASHLHVALRLFLLALLAAAILFLMSLLGEMWPEWVVLGSLIPLIFMNGLFGLLAGVTWSLGKFLARPAGYDRLQQAIIMKNRTRHRLKTLLLLIVLTLAPLGAAPAWAGAACAVAVDVSSSVSAPDRKDAVSFLNDSLLEFVEAHDCRGFLTVAMFAEEGWHFADKTSIALPSEPAWSNCTGAEPEQLVGHTAIFEHVRTVVRARKREAVEACQRDQGLRRAQFEHEVYKLRKSVAAAMTVTPRPTLSRIADVVKTSAESGWYRNILLLSDGINMPPVSVDDVELPEGVHITMMILRPDPAYASLDDVRAAAAEWAAIDGVTVLYHGDLHSGIWTSAVASAQGK